MIHLIWSTVNLIIVLYFLYLIFGFIAKGKQIFKPKYRVASIFILVIGVLQIYSASNSEERIKRIEITDNFNKQDFKNSNNADIKEIILEDNLTFDIKMYVIYSIEQNEFIPVESYSVLKGLVMGYEWDFKSIQTNKFKPGENAGYTAIGILKWNLFGINVYSEFKTFSGIIR